MIFPAPRDAWIAERIERRAAVLRRLFPYRSLLDCREVAAVLVDTVLTWDAMWPEAEGDCACPSYLTEHRPECNWSGPLEGEIPCNCSGLDHVTTCPNWTLPL